MESRNMIQMNLFEKQNRDTDIEKIFKKSIRGRKLYSLFKKKEKKKRTCLKLSIRNY